MASVVQGSEATSHAASFIVTANSDLQPCSARD